MFFLSLFFLRIVDASAIYIEMIFLFHCVGMNCNDIRANFTGTVASKGHRREGRSSHCDNQ